MKSAIIGFLTAASLGVVPAFGSDDTMESRLRDAFGSGELDGLHSVLVIHEGVTLAEVHFAGDDQRWGTPLGERSHGPDTLHDLRSVTKPVVGMLYGIARAEGKVPEIDEPLIARLPKYADLARDPARQGILIRHALSMTMGTQWNEDGPYTGTQNSEVAMEHAADRYRFVLDRPIVHQPGERWTYNGGAVAVVAKLIADGVGMPIDEYAEQKLFRPLGISRYEWIRGSDGVPSAASGLRLTIRDLARIGLLVAQDGRFGGKQIVPAEWLKASFTPRSTLEQGLRYGYLWWLAPWGEPPAWVAGFGNGGQRLTVQPGHDLVIAIFAGNYNRPDDWKLPVKVIEEFIVPAVRAKLQDK